jgi:3-hydroxymyristoyl/3-hydroxydecanoyl-(acyl carrier protein) dehydratase
VAIWLNERGIAHLLQHGRADLLAVFEAHCAANEPWPESRPCAWRLFDQDFPMPEGAALDEEIARLPPSEPQLLGEHATPSGHVFELKLPLDLALFDDHFRSAPVVPGVMQVAWALAFGARRYGPMACGTMDAVKFRRLVRPGDRLHLEVAYDATRSRLDFTVRIDGSLCSSARLHVVPIEGAGHAG